MEMSWPWNKGAGWRMDRSSLAADLRPGLLSRVSTCFGTHKHTHIHQEINKGLRPLSRASAHVPSQGCDSGVPSPTQCLPVSCEDRHIMEV